MTKSGEVLLILFFDFSFFLDFKFTNSLY